MEQLSLEVIQAAKIITGWLVANNIYSLKVNYLGTMYLVGEDVEVSYTPIAIDMLALDLAAIESREH